MRNQSTVYKLIKVYNLMTRFLNKELLNKKQRYIQMMIRQIRQLMLSIFLMMIQTIILTKYLSLD